MAPEKEAGDDLAVRRRRLRWRAWHRGTRELDLILGPFLDARLGACGPEDLARLEALMSEDDTDLLRWMTGQAMPPPSADPALVIEIRDFIAAR